MLGIGIAGILYVMAAWWYDVIHEAETGDHTRVVQISHRYGMILFIASEVMFFVAWFWAFFDASLFTDEAIQAARVAFTGGIWPPKGTEVLDPLNLPLLNTLILLTSGTTVTWAHHALLHNDRQGLKTGLALTIVLGIIFTCVQAWEYAHAPFALLELDLRRDLLHGDRLPRRPCHHRHDLPDRLPGARPGRPVHAAAASRLRIRRLVLALRRRGVAVPVLLHLRLGFLGRAYRGRAARLQRARATARLFVSKPETSHYAMADDERRYPPISPSAPALPAVARAAARAVCSAAFSTVAPRCEVCGLDFGFADSGDGPAVFVTLIAGFLVLGVALAIDMAYEPPLWVYIVFFLPLTVLVCLGLLRPLKGLLVASQYQEQGGARTAWTRHETRPAGGGRDGEPGGALLSSSASASGS